MDPNQRTDRRAFLAAGGAAAALSLALAACSGPGAGDQIPVTGTLPPTDKEPIEQIGAEFDVTLLRTAQSIESLAVLAFGEALDTRQGSPELVAAAREIQAAHQSHVATVGDLVVAAGGRPHPEPNAYLLEQVVQPGIEGISDEATAAAFLVSIENLVAQTEIFAGEMLSRAQLRQAVVAVGAANARQLTVLYAIAGQPPVAFPLFPVSARAPEKAYLPE